MSRVIRIVVLGACLAGAWGTPGQDDAAPANTSPHGALSTPCADCHTTDGWRPLADPLPFDHAETGFALVAGHGGVACLACHGDLRFFRVASACADCHQDPHLGALGLACARCHHARGFELARREQRQRHAATLFPLTGAHAAADCASCHRGTAALEFAVSTECFSCHAAAFRRVPDPNHQLAGFSTTCQVCHGSTETWLGAELRAHDSRFFPLYSGAHAGIWGACGDCHPAAGSLAVVTCLLCHQRQETGAAHGGVAGYRYDSAACLACHPTGSRR